MGFTERVSLLSDYDRSHRSSPLVAEPSLAQTDPYRLVTSRQRADQQGRRDLSSHRSSLEAGHPRHVPETWPTLLSRDQLCAYVGVSAQTLIHICPVPPLALGANLVRYSRAHIDEWVATLPPRLIVAKAASDAVPVELEPPPSEQVGESRTESALERVRARAGGSKWRKTA